MMFRQNLIPSTSWYPFQEMAMLQKGIDQIFEEFFSPISRRAKERSAFSPACELNETESHYFMSMDLPGLQKDDIKIEVTDRHLLVSGERKKETNGRGSNYTFSEKRHGIFKRAFSLPSPPNVEKIEAHFDNGVLEMSIPKMEVNKPKQIIPSEKGVTQKLLKRVESPPNKGIG